IAGFPRIAATAGPFWLMLISCQLSYPLNSENARPLGTFTVYLSEAGVAATAARTATDMAKETLIAMIRPFMVATPEITRGCQPVSGRPLMAQHEPSPSR